MISGDPTRANASEINSNRITPPNWLKHITEEKIRILTDSRQRLLELVPFNKIIAEQNVKSRSLIPGAQEHSDLVIIISDILNHPYRETDLQRCNIASEAEIF